MAIELQFGTNVNQAVDLINSGDVNPILDFNDTRYSIDTSGWSRGSITWIPFSLSLQQIIGDQKFTVPYASHNVLAEVLLGPSSQASPSPVNPDDTIFPNFPVPPTEGFVIP